MMIRPIFYQLLLVTLILSCSKQSADKDTSLYDSLKVAQVSDSTEQTILRLGDTAETSDRLPNASEVPIGSLPLLHSSVLAQFHPNPMGFRRYKSLAYDTTVRTES